MGGLETKQGQKALVLWKLRCASGRIYILSATFLDAGTSLETILPSVHKKSRRGQENNLGMVKMNSIGQSAGLFPKDIQVYGKVSETEREWVVNVSAQLKIQSLPYRNIRTCKVLTQIEFKSHTLYNKYFQLIFVLSNIKTVRQPTETLDPTQSLQN